jgi:hypothetical protein
MGITKATKNVINYQEIVDITIKDAGIADINARADAADKKNLEQEIRLNYLEGRQSASSDFTTELFLDESKTNPTYEYSSNPAEIMDNNDWNDNWKETSLDSPSFKNGFMRPRQTPYMLENIDEYNLDGIGQAYKCGISQYDSTNDCYWLISNASGSNTVSEITKLGSSLKDGRVEVMGRWYLPAYSSGVWTGIDSDGAVLYVSMSGISTTTSFIWSYLINTNGTLGQSNAPSGSRLSPAYLTYDVTVDTILNSPNLTIDSTAMLRIGMFVSGTGITSSPISYITAINSLTSFTINQICTANGTNITMIYFDNYGFHSVANSGVDTGYYNDVVVLDSSTLGVLCCNTTTNVNIVKLALPGLTLASNSITGLANFVGGSVSHGRSITKSGNDLYIRVNDTTDDKRFIYKFNLTSDIISNVAIKCSGRFGTTRNIDGLGTEGIGISREGDILEVTSTASNGKFIARRAVRNALWAENQVNGETIPITAATAPSMCMVDANGDYWTADWNSAGMAHDTAKMYRYQISTGTVSSVTFTNIDGGTSTNGILDACHDGTNVYIITCAATGLIYRVLKGTLANLIAGLGSSIAVGSGGWAYLALPNAANTTVLNGIAYDSDAGVLLVITPPTLFITTLATDGSSWSNTYKIPSPVFGWGGISYKNGNMSSTDSTNATTPSRQIVFNKSKGTTTTWFKSHIYQDPSRTFVALGRTCTDFSGNDLVSMHYTTKQFTKMKVLEDPDVMQLHTFLDVHNVLLETGVSSMSPVTERYFEPDEFADIRDCPDKQYMVVGYTGNGFSELHLDEFLAGKSTTGKDRYDVSKIRTRHYKEGASNVILIAAAQTSQVLIEKDIIIVSDFAAAGVIKVIDLKAGTSTALYTSTNSGWKYAGTLTQRNDSRGYTGVLNAELNISHSIVHQLSARTFTKEDSSNYTYQNPRTYVGISMAATGVDVLVIDWDSNNNRTCTKVYNDVANAATVGAYGHFISPSGTVYMPQNGSTGPLFKGLFPIWQLNTDAGYAYDSTQKSIILGGTIYTYANLISRSSTCYKKVSGEWTDILLYTNRSTEAVMLCNTSSLFNSPAALVSYTLVYTSSQDGFNDVDNYEDKIFFASHENTSAGVISNLTITRRLSFNDYNTHMSPTGTNFNGFTSLERINSVSRPRMNPASTWEINSGITREKDVRFSPLVNKLAFGNIVKGLILFHFYNQDQCTHQSIDFDAENPSQYLYKQSIKN